MCEYVKYCSICGSPMIYSSLDSFRANKKHIICRSCARKDMFKRIYPNKIEKLLLDTPETYYWIGYLLSDGHIDKNCRIKFTQNGTDKISVEKFRLYLEGKCDIKYSKNVDQASFSIMNKDIISQIAKKFDIKSNKTYNPPKKEIFEQMDIDLLAYLFIGFVDGDGHIANLYKRTDFQLSIRVHSSWYDIINVFAERLFGLYKYVKITKDGYCMFAIGNTKLLKDFKRKYLTNISFEPLKRKWDVIDLNYIGKYEKSEINFKNVNY